MTPREFEERLLEHLHRRPFQPFVVEYVDGERFEVDAPHVAWNAGGAGYIGPDDLVRFFDHNNTKAFHVVPAGAGV